MVYLDLHTWLGLVIVYPLIENFVWRAGWPSNIVVHYTGIPPRPKTYVACDISMACCKAKSFIELDDGIIFQESPINLMVKTMVSCRFSLKPIQWIFKFNQIDHFFGFGPYISSISPYFTSSWVQIPHHLHDKGNPPFRFLVRWFSQP